MLIHLPKDEKGAIQLSPISEISTKDEFVNIKNVTRDDILAAHRIPPELLSIKKTTLYSTRGRGEVSVCKKGWGKNYFYLENFDSKDYPSPIIGT